MPLDLSFGLGAGESSLDPAELCVTDLSIEMGAGQTTVDLNRAWPQDLDVSIRGGVGQATVYLPADAGVRAEVRGGLGAVDVVGLRRQGEACVNDAYGAAEATLTLDIEGGVGQLTLEVVD